MNKKGFTLIELIVVIAIIALMVGGGMASYSTLSSQQKLNGETRKLRSILETAKEQALSGDNSSACTTPTSELRGYQVAISVRPDTVDQVKINRVCKSPNPPPPQPSITDVSTYLIDRAVSVRNPTTIEFHALTGAVDTASQLVLTANGKVRCININVLGVIDEGQNQQECQ